MQIETLSLAKLIDLVLKAGPKLLYPTGPFLLVPLLVVALVGTQFSSDLAHFPGDDLAALELPFVVDGGNAENRAGATLFLIPRGADDFFLRGQGQGIKSAWFSLSKHLIIGNEDNVRIRRQGLDLKPLRGVNYPLIAVVEGSHADEIDPRGGPVRKLGALELATADETWVVLLLLAAVTFGFGACAGFLKDGVVVE